MPNDAAFDQYAHNYDDELERGLSASGEGPDHFAQGRVSFLAECLRRDGLVPRRILDFGCGNGRAARFLAGLPGTDSYVGVDVSERSISAAKTAHERPGVAFHVLSGHLPAEDVDLVYTNGVFHHIPPSNRPAALDYVMKSLRPGGLFAFWENNPWNPGTRYIMRRTAFDRDAQTLSILEARRLLAGAGFAVLRTDTRFLFPRWLGWLRPLERHLCTLPVGGQYQVLCRKRVHGDGGR
jgi:SAM-dependent methyltransferase